MKKIIAVFFVAALAFTMLTVDIQPAAGSDEVSTGYVRGDKLGAKAKSEPININTANLKTLLRLKGIGPQRAKNIIDYRSKNGLFKSTQDLKNVKGIGDKIYSRISSRIRVK